MELHKGTRQTRTTRPKMLWCERDRELRVCLLDVPQWLAIHFSTNGRPKICDGESCPRCDAGMSQMWCGYSPAIHYHHVGNTDDGERIFEYPRVVIELSDECEQPLAGKDCRGLSVVLRRGKQKYARTRVSQILGQVKSAPPPFDIEWTLRRWYGVTSPAADDGSTIPFPEVG